MHSPRQLASPTVAIVVPCFNEQAGVPQLLEKLAKLDHALQSRYALEFVLVDDGSTDGTWQALRGGATDKPNYRLIQHDGNQGIAAAIMTGVRNAQADIVCSMDSDCSYDPRQLEKMIPLLTEGVDLVTASPYHPQGRVHNVPGWRLLLSRTASALYRLALRPKLFTYTSCFRVHRRSAVSHLEPENRGFVGVAELIWKLDQQGSQIVEFPAELSVRQYGQSKMKLLVSTCGHLRLLRRALWDRVRTAFSRRFASAATSHTSLGEPIHGSPLRLPTITATKEP